jgi:1-acyl-sn-glycerol-3-phosphate acyltransferase
MDKALFKLPILGTICNAIGHFPVFFTSAVEGEFKTDKDKNAKVDKDCDEHLNNGGWLCFFPEGQINKNPPVIQSFRYGGLKKAITWDARLIMFTSAGNTDVWPRKAQVGGLPGRVVYGAKALAPNGAKQLVEELKKKEKEGEEKKEDSVLLAEYGRDMMQKEYDALVDQRPSGIVSLLMSCAPAIVMYSAFGMMVYRKFLAPAA